MTKTRQMKYWEKRINRGVITVRCQLDPANGDTVAIERWNALLKEHGGPKPAIIALLNGAKGEL